MRERDGFFLIEFVIALVLLTISTVFFVHFFIHILKNYEVAKSRLQALQIAQNHIELLWLDHRHNRSPSLEHEFIMKIRTLEMPTHVYASTFIIPQVIYQEIEISKSQKQNGMSITLPGYLYEKVR